MAIILRAGLPYGSPLMVLHHATVVIAQIIFLSTGYPSFYMAASGLLFEASNVFFIPHVLMIQLNVTGIAPTLNGSLLILTYTLCRPLACTILAILSISDLTSFDPPDAFGWLAALIALLCFYVLLTLSIHWWITSILPSLHAGMTKTLGEGYYQPCLRLVPSRLRGWLWRSCTPRGREQAREARRRFRALQELKNELEEPTDATLPQEQQPELA
uniref:TLC domain-containing protein n=1 Tax=Haptolina brevifila TaxID=156173 RepID=A0A7S2C5T3_9EUKA|mmetsp:Transcript_20017/g.40732  ORF Transcript_20017/g.40732 Transcript_20017/m.40732 type:complete len:215 (+) Transcript_20017:236-880(+)